MTEEHADAEASGLRRAFETLRLPHFGALWSGNLLQFVATQIHLFSIQWLVTDLTESRMILGAVIAVFGATVAVMSAPAGTLSDRMAKRSLLAIGRLGMFAVIATLLGLFAAGWIELWHVFLAALAIGLLSAISQPAMQTYVFEVVGIDRAQPAVALNSAGIGLGQMIGPAFAGVLIAGGGLIASWAGALLGLLLAVVLLFRIPVRGDPQPGHEAGTDLASGLRYVWSRPALVLALLACAMAFFNGAIFVMRPVFARHVLGVGSEGMGALAAMAGLGTLLGAAVATAMPTFRHPGRAITFSMLGFSTCVFLYAFAFSYEYVLGVEFLSGLFAQVWQVSAFSGLQLAVPPNMRGRVMGMLFTVVQLAQVGGLAVGALADRVGDKVAMGIFGIVPMLMLTGILVFGWRVLAELGVYREPELDSGVR